MAAIKRLLRLWFGFSDRVDARTYRWSGFGLMAFKYLVDALVIGRVTGKLWTPIAYLAPSIQIRDAAANLPKWLDVAMGLWTLPFAWIGVSMTIRRAVDAGWSPWAGLFFFMPVVNYAEMLVLAFLPSREEVWLREPAAPEVDAELKDALRAVGVSALVGAPLVALLTLGIKGYGVSLFFGVPFVTGAIAGCLANRPHPRPLAHTFLVVLVSQALIGGMLLLFAVEGVICLMMALPLTLLVGWMGGVIGREIALRTPARAVHAGLVLLALPAGGLFERPLAPTAVREVVTVVTVDAPPESVWRHVVAFSDLPAPDEWLFRAGIAYPVRARITGSGAGALRRCEFSTGAFVEPITAWDEPRRLVFDVVDQPPTMEELSPWPEVLAPHLTRSFRAVRGEFRLSPAPGGRTRLEGSTWYVLDMRPAVYWRVPADAIVHAIHARVLRHVARLAEAG